MAFLEIENKENSAAKTAAIVGQPTKYYLFAREVMKIRDAINVLRSMVVLTSETIAHILSTVTPIELGVIESDFVTFLNANESIVMEDGQFITYTIGEVDYVSMFTGTPGEYVPAVIPLTIDDFYLFYQSDAASAQPLRKLLFGDLNETTFIVAKNTLGYDVVCVQEDEYVKTNIPYSDTICVNIIDKFIFNVDGSYSQAEYYNIGGFLAFAYVLTDAVGDTTIGGEFSHCRILIEKL